MSIIQRLPEIVYPLTQVNKVNEIVDVLNVSTNSSYTASNPLLSSVDGSATWLVTHNLGTETINCSVYRGDNLVLAEISVTSENTITVTFNSSVAVPANTYTIVVMAQGSVSGSGGGSYTLPIASETTLGGVKIDAATIGIDETGVLSTLPSSITTLAGSGTIALADNSVNKITATGNVTFTLPSITDTDTFHQILVQLYMSTVRTINYGTTVYFNGVPPETSTTGYYTLVWEYDSIRKGWVAGAVKKG